MVVMVDGVYVTCNGDYGEDEIRQYIQMASRQVTGTLKEIVLDPVNDDEVKITYAAKNKFERIRRITGYLVGTTDRWNNAKRAEEADRVKHGIEAQDD